MIIKDLLSNVRIIADFLNKSLSDDVAKLIAEQCTFKGMIKNVQSYLLGDKEDGSNLLQKGVVGNWKEYFTPELNYTFEIDKTNRFQVAVRLFSNRSQMTSEFGKKKKVAHETPPSVSLMFLPYFDVLCDLLLNRRAATWNLFVLNNKELKYTEKKVLMRASSIRLSSNSENQSECVHN